MRYLDIRRHARRTQPGQHLSQEGVDLARRVGSSSGPYHRVVTSPLPRAIETAIAMGFAADAVDPALAEGEQELFARVEWTAGFGPIATVVRRGGAPGRFARRLAQAWLSIARSLPDEGSALVITHGGFIEAGVAACLPSVDISSWGPSCDYCEGVRLAVDGERFVAGEPLRLPGSR
ncbi:MAG: histidine phosphatase family protein [Chloroflexi bacterium]|nr:histidine phosphatase family protein [Chloroflexota bacterium]